MIASARVTCLCLPFPIRHTTAHSARLGLSQVGPPSALLVESLRSLRTGPSHEGAFVEQLCQPVRIKDHMKTSGEGCIACVCGLFSKKIDRRILYSRNRGDWCE